MGGSYLFGVDPYVRAYCCIGPAWLLSMEFQLPLCRFGTLGYGQVKSTGLILSELLVEVN